MCSRFSDSSCWMIKHLATHEGLPAARTFGRRSPLRRLVSPEASSSPVGVEASAQRSAFGISSMRIPVQALESVKVTILGDF